MISVWLVIAVANIRAVAIWLVVIVAVVIANAGAVTVVGFVVVIANIWSAGWLMAVPVIVSPGWST